jgi:hypothetical protein
MQRPENPEKIVIFTKLSNSYKICHNHQSVPFCSAAHFFMSKTPFFSWFSFDFLRLFSRFADRIFLSGLQLDFSCAIMRMVYNRLDYDHL